MNPILSSPYAKVREHLQHPSGAVAGAPSPFARDEHSLIAAASHAMADCVVAASGLPSSKDAGDAAARDEAARGNDALGLRRLGRRVINGKARDWPAGGDEDRAAVANVRDM